MAPAPEHSRSSQEALLQLEKGSAGPGIQLQQAAQILGIDLALCASHPEFNRDLGSQLASAPKEEWVLRWLLKKLKTKSYRVDPTSFVLFQQLIHRIPTKTLAATLNDYKFLTVLNDVLKDLEEDILGSLRDSASGLERSGSESSHTLGSSPIQDKNVNVNGQSRKRKRTETAEGNASSSEQLPSLDSSFSAFISVLDCLYSLTRLANKRDNVERVAHSHLRQALRAEPVFVAGLLAKSMKLAAYLIVEFSRSGRTTDLQHLLHVTAAVFDLWDLRSERQDDPDNNSSKSAFAENCFVQALRVQVSTRLFGNDSEDAAYVVHAVERLLALHVVLPARSAFFSRGGSGIDYSQDEPDWSAVKPVTDTFRPLLGETSDPEIHFMDKVEEQKVATLGDTTRNKNPSWRPAELLPTFLDVIIRSVPRDTFHRQATEASWLETSFVAVAELAFSTIKQASPSHDTSKFVPILEEMFGVIRSRKVQLSLNTFLTHAAYTGLLKDGLEKVQWSLVALLVELGVDIFLPNSGFKDSQRLLTALLGKIMLQWTSSSSHKDSNGIYPLIKTGVVIPLLRGFAAARALPEFTEIWREQLVNVETARVKNDTLARFSIWEDDDLVRTYGELMSSSLTDAQIVSHVERAIVEIKSETGSISTTATSYAYFVILEAGSETWTHYGGLTESINSLKQVLEASKTMLSSRKGMHWRWRLWRLSGNLLETSMKSPDGSLNHFGTSLVDQAVKLILRLQEQKAGSKDYPEILEAFRFVLKVTKGLDDDYSSEKLTLLTESITTFLRSLVPADGVPLEGSWNGRVEELDSPVSLAIAFLVSLLRTPEVWAKIKAENRQAIFAQLLALATVPQHETGSSPSIRHSLDLNFLQLWTALVSHEYLVYVAHICRDLLDVLSDRLDKSVSDRSFIVSSLQRFPTRLVSRHHRGVILDTLKEILLSQESSLVLSADILCLMAKWAPMPKSAAAITSDWEALWKISKAIQLEGSDIDLRVMQSLRCLAKAVISKLILLSDEERQRVFKKMYRKLSSSFSKLERFDDKALEPFLFSILLSQLWERRTEISGVVDVKDLKAQRKKLFKLVLANLRSEKDLLKRETPEEKDVIAFTKSLDALESLEDIAQGSEEANACLEEMERNLTQATIGSGRHLQKLTRRRILAGTRPGEKIELPTSKLAKVFPLQHLYGEEQQQFVREATDRFRSMSSDELVKAIQDLREAGFLGANATYNLLLAGLAVASLSPVEEKESAPAKELSALCGELTKSLQRSTSIEQFSLAAEGLEILLRSHPRAVTQWNVDDILATVARSVSAVGPHVPSEYAQTIYVRLCRLTGVLFGLYRQKVGGRFHLIVPVMQHLLACFFLPNRKRKRASQLTVQRPPWLARLDASNAVHFTRLLTSLCDPTVSAVSRPTQAGPGHEALTDQTKKAKRIAGQNLQHLVSAYAQWSLHSPVDAETKAALLPGLYAVLDVMSRETKRSLNASLDASGRAIFKTLYDDYVKFGKWNNKA